MRHVKIHVEHEHSSEILEGILVKEDDKHVTIKLSSGYNIGINRKNVKKIEDIETFKEQKSLENSSKVHEKIHTNSDSSSLPKVLILHTGGTIASKVDYRTGGTMPTFSPSEIVSMFPELKELAHIESHLFANMWSEDMNFSHYNLIAKKIEEEIQTMHGLKGIIVTHGTDTIHYTSAALSFMFEHLPIPVVIVGSQRSSDRGSSDAAMNLISAVAFIANTNIKGVFICMHENMDDNTCTILNGLNAKKMHSSRRDAFKPINSSAIARVNYDSKTVEYVSEYPESTLNLPGHFKVNLFNPKLKIGILKSHPNMVHEEVLFYEKFDGLILEGTGLCNFPVNKIDEYTDENAKIMGAFDKLAHKVPIIMALQTVYGTVNMNVYQTGRDLQKTGIIGNHSSLITETAFIKLAFLLSQKLDPNEYFMKDLRGEFSSSSNSAD